MVIQLKGREHYGQSGAPTEADTACMWSYLEAMHPNNDLAAYEALDFVCTSLDLPNCNEAWVSKSAFSSSSAESLLKLAMLRGTTLETLPLLAGYWLCQYLRPLPSPWDSGAGEFRLLEVLCESVRLSYLPSSSDVLKDFLCALGLAAQRVVYRHFTGRSGFTVSHGVSVLETLAKLRDVEQFNDDIGLQYFLGQVEEGIKRINGLVKPALQWVGAAGELIKDIAQAKRRPGELCPSFAKLKATVSGNAGVKTEAWYECGMIFDAAAVAVVLDPSCFSQYCEVADLLVENQKQSWQIYYALCQSNAFIATHCRDLNVQTTVALSLGWMHSLASLTTFEFINFLDIGADDPRGCRVRASAVWHLFQLSATIPSPELAPKILTAAVLNVEVEQPVVLYSFILCSGLGVMHSQVRQRQHLGVLEEVLQGCIVTCSHDVQTKDTDERVNLEMQSQLTRASQQLDAEMQSLLELRSDKRAALIHHEMQSEEIEKRQVLNEELEDGVQKLKYLLDQERHELTVRAQRLVDHEELVKLSEMAFKKQNEIEENDDPRTLHDRKSGSKALQSSQASTYQTLQQSTLTLALRKNQLQAQKDKVEVIQKDLDRKTKELEMEKQNQEEARIVYNSMKHRLDELNTLEANVDDSEFEEQRKVIEMELHAVTSKLDNSKRTHEVHTLRFPLLQKILQAATQKMQIVQRRIYLVAAMAKQMRVCDAPWAYEFPDEPVVLHSTLQVPDEIPAYNEDWWPAADYQKERLVAQARQNRKIRLQYKIGSFEVPLGPVIDSILEHLGIPRSEVLSHVGFEVDPNRVPDYLLCPIMGTPMVQAVDFPGGWCCSLAGVFHLLRGQFCKDPRTRREVHFSALQRNRQVESFVATISKRQVATYEDAGHTIREWFRSYWQPFKEEEASYIRLFAKAWPQAKGFYDLEQQLTDFLKDPQLETFVVSGGPGSGKTTFMQHSATQFWNEWKTYTLSGKSATERHAAWLPIYISLPVLRQLRETITIEDWLAKRGIPESQISFMREHHRIILFLDAYDEAVGIDGFLGEGNVTLQSLISSKGAWQAKVVVACRQDALRTLYDAAKVFVPQATANPNSALMIMYIAPFTRKQIRRYLKKQGARVDLNVFENVSTLAGMSGLIRTPLGLKIASQITRRLYDNAKDLSFPLDLTFLYEQYTDHIMDDLARHHRLSPDAALSFKEDLQDHCMGLATSMQVFSLTTMVWKNQDIEEILPSDQQMWAWVRWTAHRRRLPHLPVSIGVEEDGWVRYSWPHVSQIEFFAALYIRLQCITHPHLAVLPRLIADPKALHQGNVLQAVGEQVSRSKEFKALLFQTLYQSKESAQVATSASNAISVLNAARVSFSGMDFSGVRIPGAMLEGACLHMTSLKGADLAGCNMMGAFLCNAVLSEADMSAVDLGQKIPLIGHTTRVTSVCACTPSPGVHYVASAAADASVRIWECRTGRCLKAMEATCPQLSIASSRSWVASGGRDGKVLIWSLENFVWMATLEESQGEITALVMSNMWLAAGDDTGRVRLYTSDTWTFQPHQTFQMESAIQSLALSPTEPWMAISEEASTCVKIADLSSWSILHSVDIKLPINGIAFSPKGYILALSHAHQCTVSLWDCNTTGLSEVLSIKEVHKGRVHDVQFSLDGNWIGVAGDDNTSSLWDWKNKKRAMVYRGHTKAVTTVCFAGDPSFLVSGSDDGAVMMWPQSSWRYSRKLNNYAHHNPVTSVAFSNNALEVAYAYGHPIASVADVDNGELTTDFPKIPIDPKDKYTQVLDMASGDAFTIWDQLEEGAIQGVAISPTGQHWAYASGSSIGLWNKESRLTSNLEDHRGLVTTMVFTPNGQWLASGSWDMNIIMWDVSFGRHYSTITQHTGKINQLVFANSNTMLMSASDDKTFRIFTAPDGVPMHLWHHPKRVTCVALNPSNSLVLTGCGDQKLRVWQYEREKTIHEILHPSMVVSVGYLSGDKVATGCLNGALYIYDALSWACIQLVRAHEDSVGCMAVSPLRNTIATGGDDGAISVWEVIPTEEASEPPLRLKWRHNGAFLCEDMESEGITGLMAESQNCIKQFGGEDLYRARYKTPEVTDLT